MYDVLRKLEEAYSNIRLQAIFYIYILSKAASYQNAIVFSPKTQRVEDKFVLVAHILSAKVKSSWPRRKMDRVYDYGSEDFRLETCWGFSLSYGRIIFINSSDHILLFFVGF